MKYLRVFLFLGLFVCLPAVLPSGLEAQTVEGQVTWEGGEPVAGATTTLLDSSFQSAAEGATDQTGHYSLTAPSAGSYIVVVEMEGYPSQMSDLVTLAAESVTTVDMVLAGQKVAEAELSAADTLSDADLLAAAIAESCQGQFMANLHGIIFGAVRDEATGIPLPDASVEVHRSNPYAMVPGSSNLGGRSDGTGTYLICNAPAGEELRLRATAEGTEGPWVEERPVVGTMQRIDLEVPLNDPDQPGFILGRVQDQEWGQVIRGAQVTLQETGFRTETDMRGSFKIPDVPWGQHTIVFEHPSYGTHEKSLRVIGGRTHTLEVHLPPQAVEMPPIIVRVRPRRLYGDMERLQERIDRGVGHIFTRDAIDQRQPAHLADMLRAVPGVDVIQSGSSATGRFEIRMRNAQTMLGQTCPPAVWVDGMRWRDVRSAFTGILGIELEVVEVYNGPAEVPGEFLDSSASCGAVIVWTRRGRSFGG
jgi:hypothetical protein